MVYVILLICPRNCHKLIIELCFERSASSGGNICCQDGGRRMTICKILCYLRLKNKLQSAHWCLTSVLAFLRTLSSSYPRSLIQVQRTQLPPMKDDLAHVGRGSGCKSPALPSRINTAPADQYGTSTVIQDEFTSCFRQLESLQKNRCLCWQGLHTVYHDSRYATDWSALRHIRHLIICRHFNDVSSISI